jgi:hypothetical protein
VCRWWKFGIKCSVTEHGYDEQKQVTLLVCSPQAPYSKFCRPSFLPTLIVDPNTHATNLSFHPTQTVIHSTTQTLVCLLLLYTAASCQAPRVLLGTSLTSFSVNLILGIAQGTRFLVAEEAMEEWHGEGKPSPPVRIVRPLRDIGMKECAIWIWWSGLRVVGREQYLG